MSYSSEQAEVVKNAIVWTDDKIELMCIEADKNLFKEDTNLLRSYALTWGCSFDTINLKLQELRGAKFSGDYSAWYSSQIENLVS